MRFFKKKYDGSYFNTFLDFDFYKIRDARQKVNLLLSLKKSGRLLEIGCGRGELLKRLKNSFDVEGIDISRLAIDSASNSISRNRLSVLNIENKDIKGKYDIIIAFDLLEHLRNPIKIIDKIKRALNKGGIFIFSVPNKYGLYGSIMTSMFNFIDRTHVSTYGRKRWIEIMKGKGFRIDIRNQGLFCIIKNDLAKHISYNLLVIAKNS